MAAVHKACPVVLRPGREALAFRHPQAGLQLVKGGGHDGEHPADAAERELSEESGLALRPIRDLGTSQRIEPGELWRVWLMSEAPLPDTWTHPCADDGGHDFAVFWQRLCSPPPEGFAPRYRRALVHIDAPLPEGERQ